MKKLIFRFWNTEEIPYGARVLTMVTAIRWIGWGLAESLIPIFLYSFGNSFAEAGLLRSTYDIAFIVTLPIAGILADRMRATTLILFALFLYFFVGTGYLLAGTTGLAIFIVIARLLNGVAYGLDSIGRDVYIKRHTIPGKIATVFGYSDTVSNFWWMMAAIAGIFLVKYVSVPWLLFLITPTAIISFLIVRRFRKRKEEVFVTEKKKVISINIIREIRGWNFTVKSLAGFNFFISFASAVVMFFLPIEVYREGGGFTNVIIMGVVGALPMLFGWSLGKWFDVKGSKTFTISLIIFSILLLSLSFFTAFFWRLIIVFLVTMITELLSIGSEEIITSSADPKHFGRIEGIIGSISDIGSMTGPLVVGILMDAYGAPSAYISLAVLVFALAVIFRILNKKNRLVEKYHLTDR